jgi:hypothetical protein
MLRHEINDNGTKKGKSRIRHGFMKVEMLNSVILKS